MLEVDNVTCDIGSSRILAGISFSVTRGETVGIIGPNGSGKTTLFNCVSGFLKPSGGAIRFKGEEISHLSAFERAARGVGRVFQAPGIFRDMTLVENVLIALEARKKPFHDLLPGGRKITRALEQEALDALKTIGLSAKAHQKAASLSGGQLRLLEIIRAKAYGAELFLLDEPTAGVSPKMRLEVAALIRSLVAAGKTVMVIEHDLDFIAQFCHRILVIDEGRVALDGDVHQIKNDPRLQEIYFGTAGLNGSSAHAPLSPQPASAAV